MLTITVTNKERERNYSIRLFDDDEDILFNNMQSYINNLINIRQVNIPKLE